MLGLNPSGTKPPIFWCLQTNWELRQLARYLGSDQPVYGMRSGYLVMHYSEANTAALAKRYIEEIFQISESGPFLIAGNCQGGIVAVEIARQLQKAGRQVRLLILLDAVFPELLNGEPYAGPVALFAGVEGAASTPIGASARQKRVGGSSFPEGSHSTWWRPTTRGSSSARRWLFLPRGCKQRSHELRSPMTLRLQKRIHRPSGGGVRGRDLCTDHARSGSGSTSDNVRYRQERQSGGLGAGGLSGIGVGNHG